LIELVRKSTQGTETMNEAAMREFLKATPFEPFVVVMSSGDRHLVKHPENALLTKTRIYIANPEDDTVAVCALLHVATVETQQIA
jgi:hypothetical protein